METTASIQDSILPKDFATSIDLKDAYFHILIHPKDQTFLRFVWGNRIFLFQSLSLGLSLAPLVFTKITCQLVQSIHQSGIRRKAFLDDWLILASSRSQCATHVDTVLLRARQLGFIPNLSKSDLIPSQESVEQGIVFNTITLQVKPTQD